MMRRDRLWALCAGATLVLLLVQPALADDCGSLSDCASGIALAIAIAAALAAALLLGWLMLPWLAEALAARTAFAAATRIGGASAARAGAGAAARTGAGAGGRFPALWDAAHSGAFNPSGGTQNCAYISQNIARYWRGQGFRPAPPGGPGSWTGLKEAFGSEFMTQRSFGEISRFLAAEGHGAQGIVGVRTASSSHVFNAINVNGRIWFVDGQAGVIHQSGGSVATMSGYTPEVIQAIRFMFIP